MKILVYGAGVIGSIFAGKLAKTSYDITVLARGNRYREIIENGIILKNILNNKLCLFLLIQPTCSCNLWPAVLETFGRKAASLIQYPS